jgi:hypothetical protein
MPGEIKTPFRPPPARRDLIPGPKNALKSIVFSAAYGSDRTGRFYILPLFIPGSQG